MEFNLADLILEFIFIFVLIAMRAYLRGQGSPAWEWSTSSFMLFLIEEDPSYQMFFYPINKYSS